jgi:hypothetical protein
MSNDASSSSQSQSQEQSITINMQSSGDPDFERHIFSQVHSVGRQLSRLAAVVEVLVAEHEAAAGNFPATPEGQAAIAAFKAMQADIQSEKQDRAEFFIKRLQAVRTSDPQAFATLRGQLQTWLEQS